MRSTDSNLKRYVVTGSTSGIGKALKLRYAEYPEQFGGELIFALSGWRLGSELDSEFDNCMIIHLAHDRSLSFLENTTAFEKLSKNVGAGSIFLSTVSAHSQSKSLYGRSKYFLEQNFLGHGAAVVKSGLICSKNPTAMFKTLNDIVNRLTIIPLPFRGDKLFYLTDEESLVTLIAQLTHDSDNLTYRAFSNQAITFKQLLEDLASKQGTTRYFFELPSPLSSVLIRFFTKFLGKFSFSDSLNSLVNQPDLYELLQLSGSGVDFPPNPHLIKYT
jgi:hypothetical protein